MLGIIIGSSCNVEENIFGASTASPLLSHKRCNFVFNDGRLDYPPTSIYNTEVAHAMS